TVESVFGTRLTRRTAMKGLLAASAAGAFAAHGIGAFAQDATPGASDYPEVVIVGTEYAFDMPASVAGGWTRITLDNQGAMDHHAMLMRVNDGSTYEDLGAALQGGDFGAIFAVATSLGGPMAGPGGTASVIADLEPGQYMAICVIPDDQGVPHVALGMAANFEVTDAVEADAPVADARIELVEMMFHGAPAEIAAGPAVWEVANIGAQLHEMFIAQLAPGFTFEQISAMLLAPPEATPEGGMDHASPEAAMMAPPFTNIGGVAPMSPGYTNYVPLEFTPGEYFAICFVPDPESGAPHAALGMIIGFTVA
ncbi:MAG: hypothetical protein WKF63_05950, partial [Thermomicrobiales bacterium]